MAACTVRAPGCAGHGESSGCCSNCPGTQLLNRDGGPRELGAALETINPVVSEGDILPASSESSGGSVKNPGVQKDLYYDQEGNAKGVGPAT